MLEKLVGQGVGLWSRLKQRFETSLTTDPRLDYQGDHRSSRSSIPSQQTSSVYDIPISTLLEMTISHKFPMLSIEVGMPHKDCVLRQIFHSYYFRSAGQRQRKRSQTKAKMTTMMKKGKVTMQKKKKERNKRMEFVPARVIPMKTERIRVMRL